MNIFDLNLPDENDKKEFNKLGDWFYEQTI